MTKYLVIIVVVLLLIGGGVFFFKDKLYPSSGTNDTTIPSASTTTGEVGQKTVEISNMNYGPVNLIVKVGDKVTFVNKDSVEHTATADDNSFDTKTLSNGQSATITFTKSGTFTYHCGFHPSMRGIVVVQ